MLTQRHQVVWHLLWVGSAGWSEYHSLPQPFCLHLFRVKLLCVARYSRENFKAWEGDLSRRGEASLDQQPHPKSFGWQVEFRNSEIEFTAILREDAQYHLLKEKIKQIYSTRSKEKIKVEVLKDWRNRERVSKELSSLLSESETSVRAPASRLF